MSTQASSRAAVVEVPEKPTAVVCDDDSLSRKVVCAVLERAGYEVVAEVESAIDAIQVAMISQPDVMILDLVMPHMSGEDAIPSILQSAPGCKIIVSSSFDTPSALGKGATMVVPKGAPQRLEAVLKAMAKAR